jgi:hypothetical protein
MYSEMIEVGQDGYTLQPYRSGGHRHIANTHYVYQNSTLYTYKTDSRLVHFVPMRYMNVCTI